MLAERLGWAQLTFAGSVAVDPSASKVSIARSTEFGIENMEANFPAVISVIEKINEVIAPDYKEIRSK
jgi:electron transfer flavoprotein beta subunit